MIDEFNLIPPLAPPKGVKYLTNTLDSPIALLVKDIPAYVNPMDPREVSYDETVRQFLPGEIITDDMLNFTTEQRSTFISRYIKSGIISDNTLAPTPPSVGIDTVSTCNYAIKLTDNGSTNKLNVSYDTLDHLQIFPASYDGKLLAVYYRDTDGISYSLDDGKNIIRIHGTLETNLQYPEEITSCAVLVYPDIYNSSVLKTRLYIGTLREGLKSIEPGQSVFVQETDIEKGRFLGEQRHSTYFFRSSKWNISQVKSSNGELFEYLPGDYEPCYVIGLLNYPRMANNPILVYVKNTIVDDTVTNTIDNLHLDGQTLFGNLKIGGTSIQARYKFFTKELTSLVSITDPAKGWKPLYVTDDIKKLDICDVLRSTEYNSTRDFSTTVPSEIGQIVAVASPKDYSGRYVTRLIKYYYDIDKGSLNLLALPSFTYCSINLPGVIDPNNSEYNYASITINNTINTLTFTNINTGHRNFGEQWADFIVTLQIAYPGITFTLSADYELILFSNDVLTITVDRFTYKDLDLQPSELTGLFCYYDFDDSNNEFRETIFLTNYDKIWKLGKVIDYALNTPVYSWGAGPWLSSDNIDPDYSFRLDKNLNFPLLNKENRFDSDQLAATTTYLHGIRNFCLYKPKHLSKYIGYCGSDLGLIKFEFIFNPLENDFRFLNTKLIHSFDRRSYSSWNTDLVFDLSSKMLLGCGLKNHPPIIYSNESIDNIPVRYFYYDPTYITKSGLDFGELKSKIFYKNYLVSYVTSSGFEVVENPISTSQENIGTESLPNLQIVNRYSAINKYNFILFQDTRKDQVINNINNFKEFVRIIPRFSGKPEFINKDINSDSKFSFINVKSDLYSSLAHSPLSIEYPANSGLTKIIGPDNLTYSESELVFSIGETDLISLARSKNALVQYLQASTVKYNKYKLKLRVVDSPGKVFNPNLHYENDLEFILILNEGI